MARASYDSIISWMETALNPDLFRRRPKHHCSYDSLPQMEAELAAVPGVERVQAVRDARIVFRKTPVMVVAVDTRASRRPGVSRLPAMPTTCTRTSAGQGSWCPTTSRSSLSLGEILEVPAPYGVIRLPIVGIIVDYSNQRAPS
jgi:hypothetical protein